MFAIQLKTKASKQLQKLPKKDQQRIKVAIENIASDPFAGKKLQGDWEGRYTTRVWPYRIIYRIEKDHILVIVLAIGHRKDVYR